MWYNQKLAKINIDFCLIRINNHAKLTTAYLLICSIFLQPPRDSVSKYISVATKTSCQLKIKLLSITFRHTCMLAAECSLHFKWPVHIQMIKHECYACKNNTALSVQLLVIVQYSFGHRVVKSILNSLKVY